MAARVAVAGARCPQCAKILSKNLGHGLLHDLALVHEHHPVGHRAGKAHLVRDADHGDALAGQLGHDVEHLVDHLGVEGGGGLVKQQDLRREAERAGNGHALLLPARELERKLVGLLGNVHPLKLVQRQLIGLGLGQAAHVARRQRQVVEHAQVRKQVELLKHHAHSLAQLLHGAAVLAALHAQRDAVHRERAFLEGLQRVDAADQRGLARARGPAHHDALATRHAEVDVAQHMQAGAKPFVEALEADDGVGSRGHGLGR